MTLSIDAPDLPRRRQDDRPLAAPARARRRLRRGRLPARRRLRRGLGLRPAGRRRSRAAAILRRHRRRDRDDDRLPARQPPDRDQGLRGASGRSATARPSSTWSSRSGRSSPAATPTSRRTSAAVVDVAHAAGAIVKVIFENAYLTDDEKIRACHLTEAAGGDFVKTSTGFAPSGATHDDLRLMRANTSPHIEVKAAGGVRTLDALLEVMALGVTRVGATATKTMLDDFRARKAGARRRSQRRRRSDEGGY